MLVIHSAFFIFVLLSLVLRRMCTQDTTEVTLCKTQLQGCLLWGVLPDLFLMGARLHAVHPASMFARDLPCGSRATINLGAFHIRLRSLMSGLSLAQYTQSLELVDA